MGKEKITLKEVRPSTTRGGKNLPSRPNFSPYVAFVVAPKKKEKLHFVHHCLKYLLVMKMIYYVVA